MNKPGEQRSNLVGSAMLLGCIAALAFGTVAVLRPFLPAVVWAAIIVVATWPLMLRVQRLLGGRRGLAVTAMTLGLLVAIVAPVGLLLGTLVTRLPELRDLGDRMLAGPWPGPPPWIMKLPFGAQLAARWQQFVVQSPQGVVEAVKPFIGKAALWLSEHVGTLGGITIEFVMTLALVVVFYLHGEALAVLVRRLASRVGGPRGEESAVLAGKAMRAIAAGVVFTALLQSMLSGFGLWLVGIPAAGVLTSVLFMLCVMQIGPMPLLVPAIVWLIYRDQYGWAIALGVWTLLLSVGDAVLRPWLIQRGAKLPFMLVFGGVIGGLLAFGVVGIFIGPILLAMAKRLLERWVADK